MVMVFYNFMPVVMKGVISGMNMGMAVDMGMDMGVYQITMGVGMGVGVAMFVGMLQGDGVFDQQHGGGDHDGKADIKPQIRCFPQQHNTEDNT